MFEILKALMALKAACAEQNDQGDDHIFDWHIVNGDQHVPEAVLRAEIVLTSADVEFIEQFRQLVGFGLSA